MLQLHTKNIPHIATSPNKHIARLTAPNIVVGELTHLEVDLLRRTHGGLDVHHLDVLPLLLQQRHKEVAGKNDIALQLILVQFDMTHSNGQTQHLLHLELDGVQKSVDLLLRILTVGNDRGELSSSVQTRSHDTRKLLNESIGSEESVVLLSELTNQLLVLVEVGNLIHVHARDSLLLADLLVLIVDENTNIHMRTSGVRKLERTRETLVLGGINLLEGDLKLDSLDELSLLSLHLLSINLDLLTSGEVQKSVQSLAQSFAVNLAKGVRKGLNDMIEG